MNKQQLQQEIEALQKQLEEKQNALAAIPGKWEPKGGCFAIGGDGCIHELSSSYKENREFGIERKTLEQAEKAAKAMRAHNRLLAYVAEFAPDYNPTWDDGEFCIEYAHDAQEFSAEKNFLQRIGAVYMPFDIAFELVIKLNSGEVEL